MSAPAGPGFGLGRRAPLNPDETPVACATPLTRAAMMIGFGVAAAAMPLLLAAILLATDPPITPDVLAREFTLLCLLPAAAGAAILYAMRGGARAHDGDLILSSRPLQVEVPLEAVTEVAPLRIPFPLPGLRLRLRSGKWFGYRPLLRDPLPLLEDLGRAGLEPARAAVKHPSVVWAHAKAQAGTSRWYTLLAKFVLFGLFPAGVLFNAHQHISYGGFWGQWLIFSPQDWMRTAAIYWSTTVIYLVLYAAMWRGAAEFTTLAAAWFVPGGTASMRRFVERVCALAYYVGVPILLGIRFLP